MQRQQSAGGDGWGSGPQHSMSYGEPVARMQCTLSTASNVEAFFTDFPSAQEQLVLHPRNTSR